MVFGFGVGHKFGFRLDLFTLGFLLGLNKSHFCLFTILFYKNCMRLWVLRISKELVPKLGAKKNVSLRDLSMTLWELQRENGMFLYGKANVHCTLPFGTIFGNSPQRN